MSNFLGKKYKLESSENFNEYMKGLGVGTLTRKMAATVSPVVEVIKEGEEYIMKTISTFKSSQIKFKPGVQFDEETPDGRKVKTTITFDGNKMLQVQEGDKKTIIEREFSDTEMKAIMKVDDVVCTRIYKVQ